jgi:hypothetical protein
VVASHRIDGDHPVKLGLGDRRYESRNRRAEGKLRARLGVGRLGGCGGRGLRWPTQRAARLSSRMPSSFSLPLLGAQRCSTFDTPVGG